MFPNTVAEFIAGGLSVNALRPVAGVHTNGTLRMDQWKEIDNRVVEIARDAMAGIRVLRERGLVRNLGGLGTMVDLYETSSDMEGAAIDMSGDSPSQEDRVTFTPHGVPIPIIHKEFQINARVLAASQRNNTPLDTFQATIAARKVAEASEDMLFNGSSIKADGYTIYGLLNHPNRNVIAVGQDWAVPANIHASIRAMIAAAEADNMYGPYGLFLNKTQFGEARQPEGVDRFSTVLERIRTNFPEIQFIERTMSCPAGTGVLVQLTPDVVDLAVAQDVTTVQWSSPNGMSQHFMVMMAMAPRIKADNDGRSGVVVHTGI
jgi:uncharacterized linocin/CFP29 family protein